MSKQDNNWLFFVLGDLRIYEREAVGGLMIACEKGDKEEINKALDEYNRAERLSDICITHIEYGHKDHLSWQWMADEGHLCDMDWEWFKDSLEKAGVSKEAYDKKWK